MENIRLKVNMQLAQKKYKAEINKLTKELQEANSHILILEMQQEYAMKWINCSCSPLKKKVIIRNPSDRQLYYVCCLASIYL